jgi:hypothetical protein
MLLPGMRDLDHDEEPTADEPVDVVVTTITLSAADQRAGTPH